MNLDDVLKDASQATRAAFNAGPPPEVPTRRPRPRRMAFIAGVTTMVIAIGALALLDDADPSPHVVATDSAATPAPSVAPATAEEGSTNTELFDPGPLAPRGGHSVTWTGKEMLVWGGWGDEVGRVRFADGAAYDPETDRWRIIAEAPLTGRRNHFAAWTGREMVIVGGDGRTDGAAYDPVRDSWRDLAAAPFGIGASEVLEDEGRATTGDVLVVWNVTADRVARYDAASGSWMEMPGPDLGASSGVLRVLGGQIVALGTTSYSGSPLLAAVADTGRESWTRLPDGEFANDSSVPSTDPRWSGAAGGRLVVWSVSSAGAVVALDPERGTWEELNHHALPGCEGAPGPVPIGGRFVASSCGITAIYEPVNDEWRLTDLGDFGVAEGEGVWTGTQLLSWGGTCCYGSGGAAFQRNIAWRFAPTG
jgi:hypothetical protein